jgi:hypothetical protein
MRMWAATLHHAWVVGELTALRAAVSSTAELVLEPSPDETSQVEVMNELTTKFWRLNELCSWLEGPGVRICSLLLGPQSSQALWVDRLEEAVRRLEAELSRWCRVYDELEALRAIFTSGIFTGGICIHGGVRGVRLA